MDFWNSICDLQANKSSAGTVCNGLIHFHWNENSIDCIIARGSAPPTCENPAISHCAGAYVFPFKSHTLIRLWFRIQIWVRILIPIPIAQQRQINLRAGSKAQTPIENWLTNVCRWVFVFDCHQGLKRFVWQIATAVMAVTTHYQFLWILTLPLPH